MLTAILEAASAGIMGVTDLLVSLANLECSVRYVALAKNRRSIFYQKCKIQSRNECPLHGDQIRELSRLHPYREITSISRTLKLHLQ
jgi:hypothetical protein